RPEGDAQPGEAQSRGLQTGRGPEKVPHHRRAAGLDGGADQGDTPGADRLPVLQGVCGRGQRQPGADTGQGQGTDERGDPGEDAMIERIIEYCIRNRFLVLLVAAGLALWGVYAVLNTPVDAVPDLSENQVIVFTDWMGRSPREIEDQVTYPLSLKLEGLAGVKTVRSTSEFNYSMITIRVEDRAGFSFAR